MKTKLITQNTIYDDRFFSKYVSFRFLDIAGKRKKYFEQSDSNNLSICVPISYTDSVNILQILALRKAKTLSDEISVKVLIRTNENNDSRKFRDRIKSKFNFSNESFIFMSEVDIPPEKIERILDQIKNENLSNDIINHLTFITQFLYFIDTQKINSFLVGQNEAYLYEAILTNLIYHKETHKIYPLYIPELQLFIETIFKEGDSKERIKKYLLKVLQNYRSIERGLSDIAVLASFYDININELFENSNTSHLFDILTNDLSNRIFNDLSI